MCLLVSVLCPVHFQFTSTPSASTNKPLAKSNGMIPLTGHGSWKTRADCCRTYSPYAGIPWSLKVKPADVRGPQNSARASSVGMYWQECKSV
ncbi:hypothetical protein KC19_VG188600 [Ceratodon purpureus]|uniref:Secreted protein n=1 Tax=Ceratodon purpureus TaxID=3225 RepID=A0A8T0HRH9_CERPU|nr:hypothetical protein KC19_VG188600 [Ceratodon purpureus]